MAEKVRRDLVVIGASAGGVEALRAIAAALPADLPAAVLVVLHLPAAGQSVLDGILGRAGKLPSVKATHGARLEPGVITVGQPDHHLLVHGKSIRVTRGPRINGHRPAIDPLFRSAATWAGPRAVGVVLSGALDDGSIGLAAIARAGGAAIVQSPEDALYPSMPQSALAAVPTARSVSVAEIPGAISAALAEEVEVVGRPGDPMTGEPFEPSPTGETIDGAPSGFTCPECNGALWELRPGTPPRYQCHVGHAYTQSTLLAGQSERLEEALWAAYRALKENAALALRLAERARAQRFDKVAEDYARRHREATERADLVRELLELGQIAVEAPVLRAAARP
jgi:two-component system, chemotaxis family, protein-glutamate methylesterase/glutaminase